MEGQMFLHYLLEIIQFLPVLTLPVYLFKLMGNVFTLFT